MKTASSGLIALLNSGSFVYADLYTFVLSGGQAIYLCGADRLTSTTGFEGLSTESGVMISTESGDAIVALLVGGVAYQIASPISDAGVKSGVGLAVETVEITILDNGIAFGGHSLLPFVRTNGFDGASIKIDRAFAPDWATMTSSGPTGTVNRFSGRFSAIKQLSRSGATIEAAPWTELLSQQMPTNIYQASCNHVLFDAGCGLAAASFAVSGTVSSGSTTTVINTGLSAPSGYYTLGKIVFTSGANNGLAKTVKIHAGGGTLTLIAPLAAAPVPGDTFTVYPGCDLSQGTCSSKFGNLAKFRGFPFVPPPESAL